MASGDYIVAMAFFIVVTLDTDIAIVGVQNLSFARPGASTLAPWEPFWQLETPWGQQERQPDFCDFETILLPHFQSCSSSDGLSSICFFWLVSSSLVAPIFIWKS